jgi:hypothetical protein
MFSASLGKRKIISLVDSDSEGDNNLNPNKRNKQETKSNLKSTRMGSTGKQIQFNENGNKGPVGSQSPSSTTNQPKKLVIKNLKGNFTSNHFGFLQIRSFLDVFIILLVHLMIILLLRFEFSFE